MLLGKEDNGDKFLELLRSRGEYCKLVIQKLKVGNSTWRYINIILVVVIVGGHLGRDKTYYKISDRFYWKTLWTDVQKYVQECDTCQRTNDAQLQKSTAPLQPISVKSRVWNQVCKTASIPIKYKYVWLLIHWYEQVGIDLIGPLPQTDSGNKYIVTLVDYFSKWPEAEPIPDKSAKHVALFLYKMICRLAFDCNHFPNEKMLYIGLAVLNLSYLIKEESLWIKSASTYSQWPRLSTGSHLHIIRRQMVLWKGSIKLFRDHWWNISMKIRLTGMKSLMEFFLPTALHNRNQLVFVPLNWCTVGMFIKYY